MLNIYRTSTVMRCAVESSHPILLWSLVLCLIWGGALLNPSAIYADTYGTTEGDTIVITNQPTSKQKRKGRVINRSLPHQSSSRICFLENRKTKEKQLTTNPSKSHLKVSRIIWCEETPRKGSRREAPPSPTKQGRITKRKKKTIGGGHSLPKRADQFKAFVTGAALKYKLPEALLWAFMKVESDFVPTAVSRKGAQGLMQLMPLTAKDMGVNNPFDAQQNIYGAAKLISILMKRFNRELPLVISAYHAGGGAVSRREGIPYSETSQYMTSVLNAYYRYMKKPPYVRD